MNKSRGKEIKILNKSRAKALKSEIPINMAKKKKEINERKINSRAKLKTPSQEERFQK